MCYDVWVLRIPEGGGTTLRYLWYQGVQWVQLWSVILYLKKYIYICYLQAKLQQDLIEMGVFIQSGPLRVVLNGNG